MADAKITQLNENTAPALGDYMPLVDDPSGTPETQYSTIQNFILNRVYPVGYVYISVDSTSPATLFGGTWAAFGAGRVLVGLDSGDTDFDTAEEMGGSKTHTMTTAEMPTHDHFLQHYPITAFDATSGGRTVGGDGSAVPATPTSGTNTADAGTGDAFSIMNPYITVYMWKRTA